MPTTLLVLSQESKKLYEVTRTGQVLSMYNLGAGPRRVLFGH